MQEIDSFKGRYAFLSNFYSVTIWIGGRIWPSVEHYYQAMKTLDVNQQNKIRHFARNPGEAKKFGRQVRLREDWEGVKDMVMMRALKSKFAIPSLAQKLLDTKPFVLVEGNHWHDNYWGRCNCVRCRDKKWENKLGKMLMEIREGIEP